MKRNERNVSWYDKYHIALKENLTIKEIMLLRDIGQPSAIELREQAVEYCVANDIPLPTKQVPTDVIMRLTGRNLNFYHDKMMKELEAKQMYFNTFAVKQRLEAHE